MQKPCESTGTANCSTNEDLELALAWVPDRLPVISLATVLRLWRHLDHGWVQFAPRHALCCCPFKFVGQLEATS